MIIVQLNRKLSFTMQTILFSQQLRVLSKPMNIMPPVLFLVQGRLILEEDVNWEWISNMRTTEKIQIPLLTILSCENSLHS